MYCWRLADFPRRGKEIEVEAGGGGERERRRGVVTQAYLACLTEPGRPKPETPGRVEDRRVCRIWVCV